MILGVFPNIEDSVIPPQILLPSLADLSSLPSSAQGSPRLQGGGEGWGVSWRDPECSEGSRAGHFPCKQEDWSCHSCFRFLQPGLVPKRSKVHQGSPFHQRRSGPGTYGHGN